VTRRVFTFPNPDRCVIGTVGLPGERTFFLQVRQGSELVSVVIEKQQALALAERVEEVIDEAERDRGLTGSTYGPTDLDPLDAPIVEEFRATSLALGWDEATNSVVIEAHAEGEVPDIGADTEDGPDTVRIWLDPTMARTFSFRARSVVLAGRPTCPFCSQPLDPSGHVCPRANGYRRR
jgi:uncharacterized repeat protein (TIGR03847 family)